MSTLKVEVLKIENVFEHPNADRLEIARVLGWNCVVQKGKHSPGDLVIYFPIDSILPELLEAQIFGKDSKVKLHNHRIKTIKLRGAISQGLAVDFQTLGIDPKPVGTDLTKELDIKKYEPPPPRFQGQSNRSRSNRNPNPNFSKYTSIENIKNYNKVFEPDDEVVITEKIHGSNFRASWVLFDSNTIWKKVKKFLRLAPKYEFVYGSHNVQLSHQLLYKGWYDKNVYADAVVTYNLKERLAPGQAVYGEIYGPNIQKGYGYGVPEGETRLVIFDVMQDGKYLDHYGVRMFGTLHTIDVVPTLYEGKFKDVDMSKIVDGPSVFCPAQKVREGVVVRSKEEDRCHIGRKILKAINTEYLLKEQTEYH